MQAFNGKIVDVYNGGRVVTLNQLASECELDPEDFFGVLESIGGVLKDFSFELDPPIEKGGPETKRVLRPMFFSINVGEEVSKGETYNREFKSTAFTNLERKKNQPNVDPELYSCPKVLHSALKTIAAFSNSEGGDLFVGISDEGNFCGIELDFPTIRVGNSDEWELKVRNAVESKFTHGVSMLSFTTVQLASH